MLCPLLDTLVHYFVVVLSSGGVNVIGSQLVSTRDSMVLNCLHVPGSLHLNAIPQAFGLILDVYAMVGSGTGEMFK